VTARSRLGNYRKQSTNREVISSKAGSRALRNDRFPSTFLPTLQLKLVVSSSASTISRGSNYWTMKNVAMVRSSRNHLLKAPPCSSCWVLGFRYLWNPYQEPGLTGR
jgi:hypothetical protein